MLPFCFTLIVLVLFSTAVMETEMFIVAPFLNTTKPRPPLIITILAIASSPVHVPAMLSVVTDFVETLFSTIV